MINRPRLKELLKKKEIKEGKTANLEKNDFLALVIAGFSVILPVVLLAFGVIALLLYLFVLFFQ
ncbi:MAG: hypothetical protein RR690_00950 [Longicatena sp.]